MATTSHREEMYKNNKGKDIIEIKLATKTSVKIDQTRCRDRLILNKRLKIESLEEAETVLSAQEELEKVTNATKLLKQGRKVEALTYLRKCFVRDPDSADYFIKHEGLQALRSCLMSTDSEVLHAAAWCLINISAGSYLNVKSMMHISPLLIQFLQGSDPLMQELCAWAIGNFAGDSNKHRGTLLQQGCIPPLVALVSSQYHLTLEARSQSVLFALINLARDETYACTRFLMDCSLFDHLASMLRTTPVSCDLCFEIGWLTNYIYGRQETYQEHEGQYCVILNSVIIKLAQAFSLEDKAQREKMVLPYLHSLGNMVGLSADMALTACDNLHLMPTLLACLTCSSEFIQKEALWVLVNIMVEPSCRVLLMCQPRFLSLVLHLCQAADVDTVWHALYLLEATSKVSSWMCSYLVEHDVVSVVVRLLGHCVLEVQEAVLDLLMDLVTTTAQGMTVLIDRDGLSHLRTAAANEKCNKVTEKANYLINLIENK